MANSKNRNEEPLPEDEAVVDVGDEIPSIYFNCVMHEEVQMRRKVGLWCNFGERYGNLQLRLLGGLHFEVVGANTKEENRAKQNKFGGLTGELEPEELVAARKRAAYARVSGAKGWIQASQEQAATAARFGLRVIPRGNDFFIHFVGSEDKKAVQETFKSLITLSDALFTGIWNTSEKLTTVADKEIHEMGEGFVYGAVEVDG